MRGLLIIALILCLPCWAQTVHYAVYNGPVGTGDGLTIGNATDLQDAIDDATNGTHEVRICYDGSNVFAAPAGGYDFDTNVGTTADFIEVIGYEDDGSTIRSKSNPAILDGTSTTTNGILDFDLVGNYYHFKFLHLKDSGTHGYFGDAAGQNNIFESGIVSGCTGDGLRNDSGASLIIVINTEITDNAIGVAASSLSRYIEVINCDIHDNSSHGILLGSEVVCLVTGTVLDTNGGDGIRVTPNATTTSTSLRFLLNCTFYNNGSDGLDLGLSTVGMTYLLNPVFNDNTLYGIFSNGGTSAQFVLMAGYASEGNVSGHNDFGVTPDITADPNFVDAPNRNFTPDTGSPLIDAGYVNGGDIGAVQAVVSGGGGGSTFTPKMRRSGN